MPEPQIVAIDKDEDLNLARAQHQITLSRDEEKFCQLMADGLQQSYAYKEIHPKKNFDYCASEASRLMRRPHIVARIAQLRAEAVQGFDVSRNFLLENMLWALNAARERSSTDQVRKIVMDIGKIFGLVIEKSEADVLHKFQVMQDVTLDGNTLNFQIGNGKVIDVKGEKIDAITNPPPAVGALGVTLGGTPSNPPKDITPEQQDALIANAQNVNPKDVAPLIESGKGRKVATRKAPRKKHAKFAGRAHAEKKAMQKLNETSTSEVLTGEELL